MTLTLTLLLLLLAFLAGYATCWWRRFVFDGRVMVLGFCGVIRKSAQERQAEAQAGAE